MPEYQGIKPQVIARLEENADYIKKEFGIETLRLFGSVSREEDTPDSDIDLLYTFTPAKETYDNLFDLHTYLVGLLGRDIDLVSEEWSSARFLACVHKDTINCCISEI